ncbi:uncharacterized protein LOC113304925 [Papaver somniferum]|uniref:uncharacterized protein LOC113304925 n=1 Tax=Papaver somniferum TaxID=3469 RepID=UPI000E7052BF|nr:uncharacterized protein LOC113304925 [Papaver somniferum]
MSTADRASTQRPSSHSVDPQMKIMSKNPIKYALVNFIEHFQVDAFTDKPFKENPAAVCMLEDEDKRDDGWFIRVAAEFNAPITRFLTPIRHNNDAYNDSESDHHFNIRWFTSIVEVNLCGHGTLAAAQYLFTCGLVKSDKIEFLTPSGINLTVKKILSCRHGDTLGISKVLNNVYNGDIPNIPLTLNGVSILNVKKTVPLGDVLIEVSSGQSVIDLKPNFHELQERKGRERVICITGKAPEESGFDFISRVFAPTVGVLEASPRGRVFDLHLDE